MRKLTDREDDQLRKKYESAWSSSVYRPQIVSNDPVTLRLFILQPSASGVMSAIPVDISGFDITLEQLN